MNTIHLGIDLIKLDTVDSTNTHASRLLRMKKLPEGTVILADNQTNGRGQSGNAWESEPGKNLTFSVVIYPTCIEIEKQFYISMSISNGIIDFLQENKIPSTIKWPNDICAGNSKIAGILIENTLSGNLLQSSVIGVGLNVNQHAFRKELGNVTSMYNLNHREFDLNRSLESILEKLNNWIDKLYGKAYGNIKNNYLNNLMALNEWRTYNDVSGKLEGMIVDVADSGLLMVKKRTGTIQAYSFKEISY